jgi:putative membrane protein
MNLPLNVTNELAKQRNRDAAERTLMAWIRTCLSLISFGFGLDKIVSAINSRSGGLAHAGLGVQLVAMGFVVTGVMALLAAILQHRRALKRLRLDDTTYRESRSLAILTAAVISGIGVLALVLLLVSALPP